MVTKIPELHLSNFYYGVTDPTDTTRVNIDADLHATKFTGDLTGNAATATKLATTRALTIGSTAKNFDGSAAVTWSLAEIGAAASSHTHTIANVTDLQTTLNGKAASSHTHTIANVTNLQTTLDGKVPTGRTVTAGNGLTGGGALSDDVTVTLGTPSTCSTSTSNEVTSTSHTHAITGMAASSHTHSYVPIATSSTFPVGTLCVCIYTPTSGSVANGSTTSGSNLKVYSPTSTMAPAHSGTWKNVSGITIKDGVAVGSFVRTA